MSKKAIDFLNSKLLVYTESFPGDEPAYFNVRKGFDSNSNKIILVDLFVNSKLLSTEKFHGRDINAVTTIKNGIGNLCIYLNSSEGLILNQFSGQENETFKNVFKFTNFYYFFKASLFRFFINMGFINSILLFLKYKTEHDDFEIFF